LSHRILIEEAKGILRGREGISADVAYKRMRSAARSSRRPVAEVAQIVVDDGPWGLPRKDSLTGLPGAARIGVRRRPDGVAASVRWGSAPDGPWRGRALAAPRRPRA